MTATFIARTNHKKAFSKKKILEHSYYVSKSLWIIYIVSHAFYGTKNLFSYVGIATIVWKCGVSSGIPKILLLTGKIVVLRRLLYEINWVYFQIISAIWLKIYIIILIKTVQHEFITALKYRFVFLQLLQITCLKKSIWIIFTMKLSFLS